MMTTRKRIRTVLYDDQRILPAELDLLHTPALQRLYDLHQLGLADRVYIDASHSRLHHVVGVLEQIDNLATAITRNLGLNPTQQFVIHDAGHGTFRARDLADEIDNRRPVIRLIGLFHDLTHAPYGHTVEDEINLVACKHDEPARQADAFYRLLCQYVGWLGRDADILERGARSVARSDSADVTMPVDLSNFLDDPQLTPPSDSQSIARFSAALLKRFQSAPGPIFWRLRSDEIAQLLAQMHVAMTALLYLDLLHDGRLADEYFRKYLPRKEGYAFQTTIETALQEFGRPLDTKVAFNPARDAYMIDMVGNTVCADLLDYAKRDSHFANLKLDYDPDRIAENFTLVAWDATTYEGNKGNDQRPRKPTDPFQGPCLRTGISLFSHKLRADTLGELMNLLNVRFYLYERVIFHPTKCAADAMLGTSLQLIGCRSLSGTQQEFDGFLPDDLNHVGDAVFLHSVAGSARRALKHLAERSAATDARADIEPAFAQSLIERHTKAGNARAQQEIAAGLAVLRRLQARRFFRPVFRMLTNVARAPIDVTPLKVAQSFSHPDKRYAAEREIETGCNPPLPLGSVVIHCPKETTATKIANVLILGRNPDGIPKVRKLRHVEEIDDKVFGEHKKAIDAVQEMYRSMWRLVVYVSPQYLPRYEQIAMVAGRVIVQTLGGNDTHEPWPNDPNFEWEMKLRLEREELRLPTETPEPRPERAAMVAGRDEVIGKAVRELAHELNKPKWKLVFQREFVDKSEIKKLLAESIGPLPVGESLQSNGKSRGKQLHELVKPLYRRLPGDIADKVVNWGDSELGALGESEFHAFRSQIQRIVTLTPRELVGPRDERRTGRQNEMDELFGVLREVLRACRRGSKSIRE